MLTEYAPKMHSTAYFWRWYDGVLVEYDGAALFFHSLGTALH